MWMKGASDMLPLLLLKSRATARVDLKQSELFEGRSHGGTTVRTLRLQRADPVHVLGRHICSTGRTLQWQA
ncbi:MAG: hypothetical protein DRP09_13420, partial [Candidatus Thorarchaeota archaeon]